MQKTTELEVTWARADLEEVIEQAVWKAVTKAMKPKDLACADSPPVFNAECARHVAVLAVQLYAEMHPRPAQVTQKQAAEMLGMCHVTVRKLIRAGVIKMNSTGQIPVSEIDRVLQPK